MTASVVPAGVADLDVESLPTIAVLAAAVACALPGAELPGSKREGLPLTDSLVSFAYMWGVEAPLWAGVETGVVRGPDHVVDLARDAYIAALGASLVAEETALLAVEALDDVGVATRALKGLALAHLDHADPAERIIGDADLLIRRADYDRALRSLAAAGFRREEPPIRVGWERRFGKAVLLRAPNGGELDLHLAIAGGYFGARIDHETLWVAPPGQFRLGGHALYALDREDRLLHAACHAVLGGSAALRAEHDVAHLVLIAGAVWETTVARATGHGVDHVVAEAALNAWADFRLDRSHPFAVWATSHHADVAQQRALATYRAPRDHGWGNEGLGVLPALGLLDRARFLAPLALPSRESRHARGRTWRDQARRAWSALANRARRGSR